MLDAYSATPVAFLTDGGVIHIECLGTEERDEAVAERRRTGIDRDFYDYLEEHFDLRMMIRYNIHEWESENAYDIERYPESYSDELAELVERRDAIQGGINDLAERGLSAPDVLEDELFDIENDIEELIGTLAGVYCDQCLERIE